MKILNLLFVFCCLATPLISSAEVVDCKGSASTSPPTKIEISIDMDKEKSFLRWIYPDGTGITQGQNLNLRKYQGSTSVRYTNQGSTRLFLQVPISSEPSLKGNFTYSAQGLNSVPVECEISGSIPAAPVCPKNKDQALLKAMDTAESINEIEFLLQCGANPNISNAKSCTPLMLAVDPECHPGNASGMITDNAYLVDFLLTNGAFVNTQDRKGETALMKSAKNGVQNVYDSFIASEADFNLQNKNGDTALMLAVLNGDNWLIQDVLDGNPDRRLKNKNGKTAYDLALHWRDQETANLVQIPDQTIVISGKADGTCTPLAIEVQLGKTIEFVLNGTDKMFKLDSRPIGLDLMADRGGSAKQILKFENRGTYKFTCGFHGANSASDGLITVR